VPRIVFYFESCIFDRVKKKKSNLYGMLQLAQPGAPRRVHYLCIQFRLSGMTQRPETSPFAQACLDLIILSEVLISSRRDALLFVYGLAPGPASRAVVLLIPSILGSQSRFYQACVTPIALHEISGLYSSLSLEPLMSADMAHWQSVVKRTFIDEWDACLSRRQ
jgi:hypothetical protein